MIPVHELPHFFVPPLTQANFGDPVVHASTFSKAQSVLSIDLYSKGHCHSLGRPLGIFGDKMIYTLAFLILLCAQRTNQSLAFTKLTHRPSTNVRMALQNDHSNNIQHSDYTFKLPIFPLRKKVRFPSDLLTLNLYEPRYLRMAEFILQNTTNTIESFGALYTSDKAQVVSDFGQGPIVPVLQVGDVGTIFQVQNSEEGMVPTRGGDLRQRIRLEAIGTQRFRVEEVISSGFSTDIESSSEAQLPFILASVSFFQDRQMSDEEQDTILKKWNTIQNELFDDKFNKLSERSRHSSSKEDLEELLSLGDLGGFSVAIDEVNIRSFALASKLMEKSNGAEQKKALLKSQCLSQRMEMIEKLLISQGKRHYQ